MYENFLKITSVWNLKPYQETLFMLNEFSHGWLCNVCIVIWKYNFTFLNITTCLIRKGFSIGKLWNSWWSVQNFLKFNFHLNCQIFSLAATTVICFIWHIGSFQLFFKIYLQNNCMNKHSFFSLILSCKKWCYMNHSYFKTTIWFLYVLLEVPYVYFPFCHTAY